SIFSHKVSLRPGLHSKVLLRGSRPPESMLDLPDLVDLQGKRNRSGTTRRVQNFAFAYSDADHRRFLDLTMVAQNGEIAAPLWSHSLSGAIRDTAKEALSLGLREAVVEQPSG